MLDKGELEEMEAAYMDPPPVLHMNKIEPIELPPQRMNPEQLSQNNPSQQMHNPSPEQ